MGSGVSVGAGVAAAAVSTGGTGVTVGGTAVAVGGTAISVGGTGVSVGELGLRGRDRRLRGTSVAVGGTRGLSRWYRCFRRRNGVSVEGGSASAGSVSRSPPVRAPRLGRLVLPARPLRFRRPAPPR